MPAVQSIMTEGPGLKQRARETAAVGNEVMPRVEAPKAFTPEKKDLIHPDAKFGDRGKEQRIDTSHMTPPLGSFKHGTDYVPKTGVYKLHEGEAVTPKDKNMKNMYSKITEGDAKPKKEVKHVITKKLHDGKILHTHVHHHPMHEDEHYVSDDSKAAGAHMEGATGDGASAAGDQAAPMTAGPSPAPAPAPAAGGAPGAMPMGQ